MEKLWLNNLRKIDPYVPGEQSKDKDIVKINANENPYPPSPRALEVLKNFDGGRLRFYPPADSTPLKKALADYYGVGVENVFVGNGSDDVIALSFQSFFNGDLPIAYPDITYSFYQVLPNQGLLLFLGYMKLLTPFQDHQRRSGEVGNQNIT